MTVQICELVVCGGDRYLMRMRPLDAYFKLLGKKPVFIVKSSMCWAGYQGTWEIKNDALHLISLDSEIEDAPWINNEEDQSHYPFDGKVRRLCHPATLDEIFPDHTGTVFADWYSGQIEAIDYPERTVQLCADVSHGLVTNIRTVQTGRKPYIPPYDD